MADVIGNLVVKLQADASGVQQGIGQAESKFNGFKSIVQGVAMGAGMAVANFAIQAGQALFQFGADSVGAASDIGETLSKTNVLFGDSADAVIAFADDADQAFGQSRQQALDAAATFATFGRAAGLAGGDLVDFSTDFVGLASDLASFNNTTPEQAIQAIGAALRGEAEPLRAYGVLLDDASMRQKALEMGIISTTKDALTPQQKVLAAQALIYAQTSAAQGDFARTSDGLANQQRILDAQWANMQATLGQALLPVVLAFTQGMNALLQNVLPPLSAVMTASVIPAMTALGETVGELIGFFTAATGSGGDLQERLEKLPEPLRGIAQLIGGTLIPALQEIVSAIRQAMGPAIDAARGWFEQFGRTVQAQTSGPLNFLQGWIAQNMPRIQQIVQNVLGAITAFWETHGARIQAVVTAFMGIVVNLWETNFRTILNIVQVALQLLTGDFEGAGRTLQGILNDWRIFFERSIRTITSGIQQWFREVDWGGLGRSIIEGIGNGIRNGAGWLADQARAAGGDLVDALKRALGISSPSRVAAQGIGVPFAEGIGVGIGEGMADVRSGAAAQLRGLADEIRKRLGGMSFPVPRAVAAADTLRAALIEAPEIEAPSLDLSSLRAAADGLRSALAGLEIAAPELPELPAIEAPEIAAPSLDLSSLRAAADTMRTALAGLEIAAPELPELPAIEAPEIEAPTLDLSGLRAAADGLRSALAGLEIAAPTLPQLPEIAAPSLDLSSLRAAAAGLRDELAGLAAGLTRLVAGVRAGRQPEVRSGAAPAAAPVADVAPLAAAVAPPAAFAAPTTAGGLTAAIAEAEAALQAIRARWAVLAEAAGSAAERVRAALGALDWAGGAAALADGLRAAGDWLLQLTALAADAFGVQPAERGAGDTPTAAPALAPQPEVAADEGRPALAVPLDVEPVVAPVLTAADAGGGWQETITSVQQRVSLALDALAGYLRESREGAPAVAEVVINQAFYGQADPPLVRAASGEGVLAALRAAGVR